MSKINLREFCHSLTKEVVRFSIGLAKIYHVISCLANVPPSRLDSSSDNVLLTLERNQHVGVGELGDQ